jgi:prepilin-type N-terminal cleavage/methylation domain-containing protein
MKNKGFTLIEILGVITLLALLSTIIILSVNKSLKDSKEKLYNAQIEEIKSAAEMWRTDNIELVDESYNNLSISELQKKGYLKEKIINPKTNENIDNELLVQVSLNDIKVDDSLVQNGYRKLEYIESTGTQYIMTDIIPSNDMGINAKIKSLDVDQDLVYFGSKGEGNTRFWIGNIKNNSLTQLYYGWNTLTTKSKRPIIISDNLFEVKMNYMNNRQNIFNGTVIENNLSTLENNTYPLTIFGGNAIGTVSYKSKIKLYELKISIGTNIIYSFIPCLRKNDNKPGLYDTVNNQFYTNSGTGEFIYKLPNESPYDRLYTKLEYIQSTGTQYIDTGYYWQHENIEIDFDGTVITNSSNQSLFGNEEYKESSGLLRNFSGVAHGSNGNYGIYIGDGNKGTILTTIGTRFNLKIKTTSDKNLKVYKDDNLSLNLTYTGTVMAKQNAYVQSSNQGDIGNIFIFANHNTSRGTTSDAIQNIGRMKLYSFKMYDDDVLVRNFVPCKRNRDNEIGLYDEVNDVFYTNSGTGTFEYGI